MRGRECLSIFLWQLAIGRVGMAVSAGMMHLHMEGFLHRDLACRNILVG